ncbi:MAG: hypothetical protein R3C24_01980 [Cyanobacteriota/Melainabacteria group bacterium]
MNDDLERRIIELACANQELDTLSKNLTLARDQALQASSYKSEFLAQNESTYEHHYLHPLVQSNS